MNWVEYLENELVIINKTIDTIKKYEDKFQSHAYNTLMSKYQALNVIIMLSRSCDKDEKCFEKVCKRICETTHDESIAMTEYSQYILKTPREK